MKFLDAREMTLRERLLIKLPVLLGLDIRVARKLKKFLMKETRQQFHFHVQRLQMENMILALVA